MQLDEYTDKVVGTLIDYDGVYGSQCVDLIKNYTNTVLGIRLGTFGGSAKTGWANKSNTFKPELWTKINNDFNDPRQVPRAGDIVFWGYGKYGHVAIVLEAIEGETYMEVLEQNAGSGNGYGQDDAIRVSNRFYKDILGWYRLKTGCEDCKLKDQEIKQLKEKITLATNALK